MRHWLNGQVLGAACVAVAAMPFGGATAQTRETAPVRTNAGLVAGVEIASGMAFKGVPYAAPPTGERRWRSPEPAIRWSGVKRADRYGPACAQAPLRGMTALSDASREDCLTLNVWTPRPKANARRPVMVWIHGGGFANGSGTSATFEGEHYAARGVVLVTLNYRLGVFGFLAHPELTRQTRSKSSGNFGLEDQIAALRWVKANIAQFGGDPANVTIFGQSAGGASVLNLVASPLTRGLFGKAIVQSGAARQAIAPATLADAEQRGEAFVGTQSIASLRALDQAALIKLAAAGGGSGGIRFGPSIDGHVLTRDPASALRDRRGPALPMLIGSNSREGLGTPDASRFADIVGSAFGANAARALALYGTSADPLLGTPQEQFATDSTFRCGAVQIAGLNAAAGAPTWQYQFEQFVPGREAAGAAHSFEVPYVFGNLSSTGFSAADYGPADRRLATLMTHYWTNFATTGDPNGPGLPRWPRYQAGARAYVRLSSQLPGDAQIAFDLRGEVCRLFPDSLATRR